MSANTGVKYGKISEADCATLERWAQTLADENPDRIVSVYCGAVWIEWKDTDYGYLSSVITGGVVYCVEDGRTVLHKKISERPDGWRRVEPKQERTT